MIEEGNLSVNTKVLYVIVKCLKQINKFSSTSFKLVFFFSVLLYLLSLPSDTVFLNVCGLRLKPYFTDL